MANHKNVQKWVRALKSGRFKQAQGTLRRTRSEDGAAMKEPGFCCLGVVCELMREENPERFSWDEQAGKSYFVDKEGGAERDYLIQSAKDWLGIPDADRDPIFMHSKHGGTVKVHASHLNDGDQLSFFGIADIVESNLSNDLFEGDSE